MTNRRESKSQRARRVRSKRRVDLGLLDERAGACPQGGTEEREIVTIDPPLPWASDWGQYEREVVGRNPQIKSATVIMDDTMSVVWRKGAKR